MERLVLIGVPRWCEVGGCQQPLEAAMAKRTIVTRAPGHGAWLRCPAVPSGGVGGYRLSDVKASCRNSRRRRGRRDRRVGKVYNSFRGSSTNGGVGSSRRCIGKASDWSGWQDSEGR